MTSCAHGPHGPPSPSGVPIPSTSSFAGVDWLTICRKLAADPAINSYGIAYPQGYGIEVDRRGAEATVA
ncbi:hypothetical protein [Streptomyces sp. AP-93]|uniref:hypothetical protein n=1 Tax=Streptomyces sp. AP-93 TaxID=2929048 RepID=UPI001FAEC63D|nr:hypothetical protein [Streptomyces sp. AP-93]MCJ0872709.1 hypothetical protein [Streptomyces sp. AP-93]